MSAIAILNQPINNFIDAEIRDAVAGEAITFGQVVCYDVTTGKAYLAAAATTNKKTARGVALDTVAAGQAVSILRRGEVPGYDVSALNFNAQLFLSNTAGGLDTAAGTTSVVCGYVVPDSCGTPQKAVYFDFTSVAVYG